MLNSRPITALMGALPFLLACQGGGPEDDAGAPGYRFVVVTHGVAANPFWSVLTNGVYDAADELAVRVDYQAITTFDLVAMSQMIDAAVASDPDGLVVSVPDENVLGPSIRAAVDAGIPVVSINSGDHAFAELGVLAHVGQPEFDAGYQGGERLFAAGARNLLCVNQEVGNISLDLRCEGMIEAVEAAGGIVTILPVDLAAPEDSRQRIAGAFAADPTLDGILTLGTTGAEPALGALEDIGRLGDVLLGTFDMTPSVLDAVRAGTLHFAIDQQQYLQGYLPVVILAKYLETGAVPGGGRAIPTGPRFVTSENVEEVVSLTARGLR